MPHESAPLVHMARWCWCWPRSAGCYVRPAPRLRRTRPRRSTSRPPPPTAAAGLRRAAAPPPPQPVYVEQAPPPPQPVVMEASAYPTRPIPDPIPEYSRRRRAMATPGSPATGTGPATTGIGRAATGRRTAPGTPTTARASSGKATGWSTTAATGSGRAATRDYAYYGGRGPIGWRARPQYEPRIWRGAPEHNAGWRRAPGAPAGGYRGEPPASGATSAARPTSIARWITGRPSTARVRPGHAPGERPAGGPPRRHAPRRPRRSLGGRPGGWRHAPGRRPSAPGRRLRRLRVVARTPVAGRSQAAGGPPPAHRRPAVDPAPGRRPGPVAGGAAGGGFRPPDIPATRRLDTAARTRRWAPVRPDTSGRLARPGTARVRLRDTPRRPAAAAAAARRSSSSRGAIPTAVNGRRCPSRRTPFSGTRATLTPARAWAQWMQSDEARRVPFVLSLYGARRPLVVARERTTGAYT